MKIVQEYAEETVEQQYDDIPHMPFLQSHCSIKMPFTLILITLSSK